jgi:hypothetical protein
LKKFTLLLILLLLASFSSSAQNFLSRSELGLSFGGMNYIGDLNNQSMFGHVNMAGGLAARYKLDSRWAVALTGTYAHIESADYLVRRNLSFRSMLAEASARVEFNFFPYGAHKATLKSSTPYIFVGIGFFKFNPQALYTDPTGGSTQWYDLQPLGTEGQGTAAYPERPKYQLVEVSVPFGVGYRWRVTDNMHVTVEYGWRKTWTDYLDDVSTTYVGADLLNSQGGGSMSATLADRTGEVVSGYVNGVGIKRGDDSLADWYSFFSVSVTFSTEMLFGWMRGKTCEL